MPFLEHLCKVKRKQRRRRFELEAQIPFHPIITATPCALPTFLCVWTWDHDSFLGDEIVV